MIEIGNTGGTLVGTPSLLWRGISPFIGPGRRIGDTRFLKIADSATKEVHLQRTAARECLSQELAGEDVQEQKLLAEDSLK